MAGVNRPLGWADTDRFSHPPAQAAPKRLAVHPLSLEERVTLATAPRRSGTDVAVRAYRVRPSNSEHMYVEYDDGRDQFIFRGGPSLHGVHAEVTPAQASRDRGRGERVLYRTRLPGVTASDAVRPARVEADRVERSGAPYRVWTSNSNGLVGDLTEAQFGRRVGDARTPGWRDPIEPPPDFSRWGPAPRREF